MSTGNVVSALGANVPGPLDIDALNTEYATGDTFLGKPIFVKVVDIIDGVVSVTTPGTDQTLEFSIVYSTINPSSATFIASGDSQPANATAVQFAKTTGVYTPQPVGSAIDSYRIVHKYTKV